MEEEIRNFFQVKTLTKLDKKTKGFANEELLFNWSVLATAISDDAGNIAVLRR